MPILQKKHSYYKLFITYKWIGLLAECECGDTGFDTVIPRTEEAHNAVSDLFWGAKNNLNVE